MIEILSAVFLSSYFVEIVSLKALKIPLSSENVFMWKIKIVI